MRALNTSEVLDPASVPEAQPQWVSCSKLNLRRRVFVQTKIPIVAATTAKAVICCQSMLEYTLSNPVRNRMFSDILGVVDATGCAARAYFIGKTPPEEINFKGELEGT